jgi:hypothetical protein
VSETSRPFCAPLPSSARFEQYDVDGDGLIAWTEVQHVDSLAKGRYFAPEPR